MTSYVVLKRQKPEEQGDWHWLQGPTVDAVSAEAAIRKAVENGDGGVFVAVPLRSFQEVAVTVETKRAITLS